MVMAHIPTNCPNCGTKLENEGLPKGDQELIAISSVS